MSRSPIGASVIRGEAGIGEYPRLLASLEQRHRAERGKTISADKKSKNFSAYSDEPMGGLTYYEESCCASPCVTSRMYAPCEDNNRTTLCQTLDVVFVGQ